jgi:hypothetical protein
LLNFNLFDDVVSFAYFEIYFENPGAPEIPVMLEVEPAICVSYDLE